MSSQFYMLPKCSNLTSIISVIDSQVSGSSFQSSRTTISSTTAEVLESKIRRIAEATYRRKLLLVVLWVVFETVPYT